MPRHHEEQDPTPCLHLAISERGSFSFGVATQGWGGPGTPLAHPTGSPLLRHSRQRRLDGRAERCSPGPTAEHPTGAAPSVGTAAPCPGGRWAPRGKGQGLAWLWGPPCVGGAQRWGRLLARTRGCGTGTESHGERSPGAGGGLTLGCGQETQRGRVELKGWSVNPAWRAVPRPGNVRTAVGGGARDGGASPRAVGSPLPRCVQLWGSDSPTSSRLVHARAPRTFTVTPASPASAPRPHRAWGYGARRDT